MILQKSQPVEAGHECLSSASAGPLKIMDESSPERKANAHEIHEKLAALRTLANCHDGPYGAICRRGSPQFHKAGVGANRPLAQR
jgi:hypothetical protein